MLSLLPSSSFCRCCLCLLVVVVNLILSLDGALDTVVDFLVVVVSGWVVVLNAVVACSTTCDVSRLQMK